MQILILPSEAPPHIAALTAGLAPAHLHTASYFWQSSNRSSQRLVMYGDRDR
jgi:hypothetical protein